MHSEREKNQIHKQFLKTLEGLEGTPTLLLHACCAPCSSAVLDKLSDYFKITVFFYNPNITDREEYEKRSFELQKLIQKIPCKNPIQFLEGGFDPQTFYDGIKGFEKEKEGGARCERCFRIRLEKAAEMTMQGKFDFFTTTLTISPLKNAPLLNDIGMEMGEKYQVTFLPSDFKKEGGYQRSIELSKEFNLYRQDYCGCEFSRKERDERVKRKKDLCEN